MLGVYANSRRGRTLDVVGVGDNRTGTVRSRAKVVGHHACPDLTPIRPNARISAADGIFTRHSPVQEYLVALENENAPINPKQKPKPCRRGRALLPFKATHIFEDAAQCLL